MAVPRLPELASISAAQLVSSVLAILFTTFVLKLVRHRLAWRAQNLPGPPHSLIWGSLAALGKAQKATGLPSDAAFDYLAVPLTREYGSICYLDLWPLAHPMCVIAKASTTDKILRIDNLPKFLDLYTSIVPVVGKESLLLAKSDAEGHKRWQSIRHALSPSFQKGTLERNHTQSIVSEIGATIRLLERVSETGEPVGVVDLLKTLTLEIILNVVIGVTDEKLRKDVASNLSRQLVHSAKARRLIRLLDTLNPVRQFREWMLGREFASLVRGTIEKHVQRIAAGEVRDEDKQDILEGALERRAFDIADATAQVKTLLFAGHDTTASTLAWMLYRISTEPEVLRKLREEHDAVFGPTSIGAEDQHVLEDATVLNKLHYTNAVIKEILRLYPPAQPTRGSSDPRYQIETDVGPKPLYNCVAFLEFGALHRHPDNFDEPDAFKPERWLAPDGTSAGSPLAWQPFSRGPKNCVGLELALLEQRLFMIMTIRKFTFQYAGEKPPYQAFNLVIRPSNTIPMIVHRT